MAVVFTIARAIVRASSFGSAALGVLLVLCAVRPASAEEAVQVTVTPKGQSWSVGDRGGQACDPTCTLFVRRDTYVVSMNEVKVTLPIEGPTVLTYEPGSPRLRTIGGWTAVGGVGAGAVLLGLGAYGLLQTCSHPGGCPDSLTVSRPVAEGLVVTAAALISVSVVGAIVFAVSGDGIGVRELSPAPDRPRRRSFDVVVHPSSHSATVDFAARF